MKNQDRILKALLPVTLLIQGLHLTALIIELMNLLAGRPLQLLAPSPTPGWTPSQLRVLTALGSIDTILILVFTVFAIRLYQGKVGARRLGLAVMSFFQVSALAYVFIVVPSGAVTVHPLTYAIITSCYVPVAMLWVNLILQKTP